MKRRDFLLAGMTVLAVLLPVVVASAADPRLDDAYAHLVKARALLAAAEDPGTRKPFDGHTQKAINTIDKAIQEIQLAKQAADSHS